MTIGDGEGCAGNTGSAGATLTANTDGVSVVGNSFKGSVKVSGNSGGVTVTGNSGTVVDQPNTVGGKTKAQARKLRFGGCGAGAGVTLALAPRIASICL